MILSGRNVHCFTTISNGWPWSPFRESSRRQTMRGARLTLCLYSPTEVSHAGCLPAWRMAVVVLDAHLCRCIKRCNYRSHKCTLTAARWRSFTTQVPFESLILNRNMFLAHRVFCTMSQGEYLHKFRNTDSAAGHLEYLAPLL